MAVPPNLPTSFVPKQSFSSANARRPFKSDLGSAFRFLSYGVLALAVLAALGVFIYGQILSAEQKSKEAALAKIEASLDTTTVEHLVSLRDRLVGGRQLLDSHVALLPFFDLLGSLALANVRAVALHVLVNEDRTANLILTGTARNFNALAAESAELSKHPEVKDAIFSGIGLNKDGSVNFSLSALLDSRLLSFAPSAASSVPAAAGLPALPPPDDEGASPL